MFNIARNSVDDCRWALKHSDYRVIMANSQTLLVSPGVGSLASVSQLERYQPNFLWRVRAAELSADESFGALEYWKVYLRTRNRAWMHLRRWSVQFKALASINRVCNRCMTSRYNPNPCESGIKHRLSSTVKMDLGHRSALRQKGRVTIVKSRGFFWSLKQSVRLLRRN